MILQGEVEYMRIKILCCLTAVLTAGILLSGCQRAAEQKDVTADSLENEQIISEQSASAHLSAEQPEAGQISDPKQPAEPEQETGSEQPAELERETGSEQTAEPEQEADPEQPEDSQPSEIMLLMVGDMLMHEKVLDSGLQEDGSYSFRHLFAQVEERIRQADLALVNQETIIGGAELGLSGYPCFNSPFELGEAEVEAGFDVILHGTNHALDKGSKGLLRCLDFWENYAPGLPYLGVNRNEEQEDELYLYEQDGMKIAILNYTYGTNGIAPPADMPYLVDYLEEDKVREDLARAEAEADFTVVCPHWGTEYHLGISQNQEWWTQVFLAGGADLVIGTHPHVIEPIEWVRDEAGNEMLVYYSLGNFVNGTAGTGAGIMNRCVGGMAEVTLQKMDDGSVEIADYGVTPLICHIAQGNDYTVYELSDYTEELAEENRIRESDAAFSLEACQKLVEKVWGGEQTNR